MGIDTGDQPEDSSSAALSPSHLHSFSSGDNSELAAQAAHPTPRFATALPFRQVLRERLLDRLTKRQGSAGREKSSEQMPGKVDLEQHTEVQTTHGDLQSVPSYQDADAEAIQSDPELKVLAAELDVTAPFAMIDPVFRQRLQTQLVDALSEHCSSSLKTPVGSLYFAYNDELPQLVSEDEIVFLDKVLLVLRKSLSRNRLLLLL